MSDPKSDTNPEAGVTPEPAFESREVIFEYLRVGNSTRVMAIDAETGTEVVFQAPSNMLPSDMRTLAISKLKYVMEKQKT